MKRAVLGWRALLTISTALIPLVAYSQAPPMPDSFRHSANYRFDVAHATRVVRDAHDRGRIDLIVYTWKPLQFEATKVVLLNHGSTGAGSIHPREPIEYVPRPLIRYFIERGYTVVMPLRRGIGGSGGHFVAECDFQGGGCTLAENREIASHALDDAIADVTAVLEQVVGRQLKTPKDTKLILAGISRGGFLSLAIASARPEVTAAVVNFVGGWLSMPDAWPAEERQARLEWHTAQLRQFGARVKAPSVWIYGSGDPFYPESITRQLHAAFVLGGGKGPFIYVDNHGLASGHTIASKPELWSVHADKVIATVR